MAKFKPNPNQLPLFTPDSAWQAPPPSEWPDFRAHAKIIGVDTETKDPGLIEKGSGFVRHDAFVCGISLASSDGQSLYLPIKHSEGNVYDPGQAIAYVKHQLAGDQTKCGANLLYDAEALWSLGVDIQGPWADIQVCEPLLDEDRPGGYSLEALAKDYLGVGKDEALLKDAASCYGLDPKRDMDKLPAKYVGPYATADAELPIRIYELQKNRLKDDGVWDIFELERRLQKSLFKMRLRGVRVDLAKAEQLTEKFIKVEAELYEKIQTLKGKCQGVLNPASSDDIGNWLEDAGVDVPRTAATGAFSVTNDWLQTLTDVPMCQALYEWRKTNKMRKDFIEKLVTDSYKGRIFSSWHALREDREGGAGGTRSGRIASSKFNMTQVPSRDPVWGPLVKSCFVADEGKQWVEADYSAQEPRTQLHYAYILGLPGAAEARQRYLDDPNVDYHTLVKDLVLEKSGRDIGRRNAKTINLGVGYGMGRQKMARQLGVTLEVADSILEAYHSGVPYSKQLERLCMQKVEERGFIYTILKRKRRFQLWEPASRDFGRVTPIRDLQQAVKAWGQVRRANSHKALNALIQGSAADQTKKAIILLDDEGLLPQIQVYDALNGSYDGPAEAKRLQFIMEHAIEMTIPFVAKPHIGPSWGELKELA